MTTATIRDCAEDARVKGNEARAVKLYATEEGQVSGDMYGRGGSEQGVREGEGVGVDVVMRYRGEW